MTTVRQLGELDVIRRIRAASSSPVAGVRVGIGDDTAVLDPTPGAALLATTDLVIENVHFRRAWATPRDIGWKAMAVNLSDIAAMGGVPRWALVALALPPSTPADDIDELYAGMREAAAPHGVVIVGGDTSASPDGWMINVTLLGEHSGTPQLRSMARAGDAIAVTGTLGRSAAGLALFGTDTSARAKLGAGVIDALTRSHLKPTARVAEGRWLGAHPAVHALMDCSDGLATDLGHICRESGVHARVELARVPVDAGAREAARALGEDALAWATSGGEDYELLVTCTADAATALAEGLRRETGTALTVIGTVVEGHPDIAWLDARGEAVTVRAGFEHFMDSVLLLELIGLGVLLLCSALLTGAEAAYFSLGRTRLRELAAEQGEELNPVAPLLRQPHELLVTLLVGITLVNIAASALAASVAGKLFGKAGLGVAIVAMTFLLSVFGEVLPMTLAVEHPRRFSSWVNRPVAWLSALLGPIRVLLGALTALTLRLVGSERPQGMPEISEEELRALVDVGAREGVVDRTEREMIHKVFELEDTVVREVMVPRPDMFCLDVTTPADELLGRLRDQLHSRVPVFEDTVDQIVGVLYTKDLLPHMSGLPSGFDLRSRLHPPYFVPESKRADALLREFQAKKLHLAVVVDEYGGTAGLVTLEDLLEELVGEIRDEFDEDERLIQRIDAGIFRVSGKLAVDELNAATGLSVPKEAFDTVGGWVLDLFGHVPHKGEKKDDGIVTVSVEKVERTRVLEVLVTVRDAARPSPGT